jgi:hypothetical protein
MDLACMFHPVMERRFEIESQKNGNNNLTEYQTRRGNKTENHKELSHIARQNLSTVEVGSRRVGTEAMAAAGCDAF